MKSLINTLKIEVEAQAFISIFEYIYFFLKKNV